MYKASCMLLPIRTLLFFSLQAFMRFLITKISPPTIQHDTEIFKYSTLIWIGRYNKIIDNKIKKTSIPRNTFSYFLCLFPISNGSKIRK